MLAVIRLKGHVGVRKRFEDTMKMLGLKKVNTLAIVDEKHKGMIMKVNDFVAWGELSNEMEEELRKKMNDSKSSKSIGLKPAKGGLKSVKTKFPRGDIGYRGDKINELIKRMLA